MEASGDGGTREEEVAFSHRTENAEFSASRASICTRSPPLGRPKGGVGQTDRHRQASRSTFGARRSPCGTGDPHAGGFLRGEPAKGRWAPAPRPRDLDRRVRSRVCRARAGSRAGPRRYGACPRLARRRPQVELQVEVQPGLVRRARQRPAPVGDQPPRVPRPSAPSPPPDRREFSLARRAPSAAVRRVRGFWSGGPPVPQGLLHAAFLANGRSAVKPGLFCEPSGQNIIQSSKAHGASLCKRQMSPQCLVL